MPHAKIIIKEMNDPSPALPGVEVVEMLEMQTFVILEHGMESGRTSVVIHATDSKGEHHIIQTSAEIMRGFASALQGAETRFVQKNAKKS